MASQIPAHLSMTGVYDGESFSNTKLRIGEVIDIYYKDDERNVSKKFVEYDVLVQHRSNGTAVTKTYNHCIAMDFFGGKTDTLKSRYRADSTALNKGKRAGDGSKVLLLCINGENHNAVIIGGISDSETAPDDKDDGHSLHFRFNGMDITINKDGELLVEYQGATEKNGDLREDVDEKSTGTSIHIKKNGNVEIADAVKQGDDTVPKNFIILDHVNKKIQVTADKEVIVTAPKVRLGGADADHPVPKGDDLTNLLGKLIDAITQLTVVTSVGTSSPPVNIAQFQQIKSQLKSTLSKIVFDK